MKNTRRALFLALPLFALICLNAFAVSAQESNPKPQTNRESYEIILQLLKSNTPGDTVVPLPKNLQPVAGKLREDFGAGDYGLMMTLLNRVTAGGNLNIKAVNPFNQQQTDVKSLGFYTFDLNGIKPDAAGEIQLDQLNFGIRVPILNYVANNGNSLPETRYEQLGIVARPLNINLNEPTVVGTLTTSRPNELLVLVMTIKPENRPVAKKN